MFNGEITPSRRFEHLQDAHIDLDAVRLSRDVAWLSDLFQMLVESKELLGSIAHGYKLTGLNDPDTLMQASKKIGFLHFAKLRVEQRLFHLGADVPRPAADPRNQKIRALEARVEDLQAQLTEARRNADLMGEVA